ncbi:MAG: DNA polymerase III subunit beta [Planctomycetota bacterium]
MSELNLDVRCQREEFLTALQAADGVVPNNNIKKILSNLQLTAEPDRMVISATDAQVGLRAILRRVQVDQPGSVLVPAKQLVGILKESRSPDVHLVLQRGDSSTQLSCRLSDGRYQLPVVASEEFPTISLFPEQAPTIPIEAETLERMIRRTIFAVDKDRSSAVLSGVYMAVQDGEFLMTATDGKVLSEARNSDERYASLAENSIVVPALTVNQLSRLLNLHAVGDVAIAVERRLIFIRAVLAGSSNADSGIQVELNSRLVEGVFPSYRNAIPTQAESAVIFESAVLASAVRRTALMTSSANRGIVMALEPERAVLSNFSHSSGTAEIPIACEYAGTPQRLGLNAGYLQEVLKVYSREDVAIELNGPGRGMIMRDDDVTFLVMPITLPS